MSWISSLFLKKKVPYQLMFIFVQWHLIVLHINNKQDLDFYITEKNSSKSTLTVYEGIWRAIWSRRRIYICLANLNAEDKLILPHLNSLQKTIFSNFNKNLFRPYKWPLPYVQGSCTKRHHSNLWKIPKLQSNKHKRRIKESNLDCLAVTSNAAGLSAFNPI